MRARYHDWEPPDEVTTHTGDRLARRDEFFAEPPKEIGEVVSAYTTLTTDKEPMSPATRLVIILLSGGGVAFVCVLFGLLIGVREVAWYILLPPGIFVVVAALCWWLTMFKHTCTYVGRDGVAKYVCSGSRDNITEELFEFRDAAELRTSQVRHYTNGVYQGTNYSYTWTDVGGRTVYTIGGTYQSEAGSPPMKDLFHYATAAEVAWSQYMLEDAQRQMTTKGEVRFRLDGKNWVAVGDGYLALKLGGRTIDCDVEDIDSVSIREGVFVVRRIDAKEGWFTSEGVFKFDYSKLGNAQLFMFVLDKIAGIRIE